MADIKYKPEYVKQAYVACSELGADVKALMKLFNVSRRTIYVWMEKYPEFKEKIDLGRDKFDAENVEKSLKMRALGYKYTETTKELVTNPDTGKSELAVTKEVIKDVAPDTRAAIYWLNNRNPERWANIRHDFSVDANVNNTHGIKSGTPLNKFFETLAQQYIKDDDDE